MQCWNITCHHLASAGITHRCNMALRQGPHSRAAPHIFMELCSYSFSLETVGEDHEIRLPIGWSCLLLLGKSWHDQPIPARRPKAMERGREPWRLCSMVSVGWILWSNKRYEKCNASLCQTGNSSSRLLILCSNEHGYVRWSFHVPPKRGISEALSVGPFISLHDTGRSEHIPILCKYQSLDGMDSRYVGDLWFWNMPMT